MRRRVRRGKCETEKIDIFSFAHLARKNYSTFFSPRIHELCKGRRRKTIFFLYISISISQVGMRRRRRCL